MSPINYLGKGKNQRVSKKKPVRFLFSNKNNLLIIFLLLTLLLQTLIFLQIIFLNQLNLKLANRPAPSLVQLVEGKTVMTTTVDFNQRTPDVIKRFVGSTMTLLFNWTGQLPPTETQENPQLPQIDPGISIGNGKITTSAYEAAFALSPDFRQEFLETLAALIPQQVFTTDTQSILMISFLGEPQQLEPGNWKVKMIASLLIFQSANQIGQAIPLNKEILLRAVQPPFSFPSNSTPLQQTVYQVRSAGLEIYLIRDLPT